MTVNARRGLLLYKTEGTAGTYDDPTSSGTALRVSDFTWGLGGEPTIDRSSLITGVASSAPELVGAFYHELTFTVELEHWAQTNVPTDHNLAGLFGTCPLTVAAGASDGDDLTATPRNDVDSTDTVSILFANANGNEYKARGCRAIIESVKLDAVGQVAMVQFKVGGLWQATPTATSINFATLSSYGSGVPVQGHYGTVDAGPAGVVGVASFEFTTGMVLRPRTDITEAYGYRLPMVDHEGYPVLKINCEEVPESTFGVWAAWLAGSTQTASVQLAVGETTGDDFAKIELPAATVRPPARTESDGMARYEVELAGSHSTYAYRFVFGEV